MDLNSVASQMQALGLRVEANQLKVDTNSIVRCQVEGDAANKKSGWYRLYTFGLMSGDQVITGSFGNYKLGEQAKVSFSNKDTFTDSDRERYKEQLAVQKQREIEERERNQNIAADKALVIWNHLERAGESAYLVRKSVGAYGLRFDDKNTLYIPIIDVKGKLWGIQSISENKDPQTGRDKNFFPYGLKKMGCFHRIGKAPVGDEPIAVVEGYATGASVYEATGYTTFVAFDSGNLAPVTKSLRGIYPTNPVIVCADDDFETKNAKGELYNVGREKAKEVVANCKGYMIYPRFVDDKNRGTDFNDLHCIEGIDQVRLQISGLLSACEVVDWRSNFITTITGRITSDIANVALVLENDPAWRGVLGYSEFSYRIMKRKDPPFARGKKGEWTDADTGNLRIWLGRNYGFTPRTADTLDAVLVHAQNNGYHPLKEYFSTLKWDGVPRLSTWLERYLGASVKSEEGHNRIEYVRLVSKKFLIAAVARAIASPIKADCVLILEGGQGKGKSTAVGVLGGDYYTDTHFALGDKDGYQQIMGVWFVELAELDSFNKAESTRAKQFFAAKSDRYRPSYGRIADDFPRQCVFVGTTNQDSYLRDSTGDRRYWPVKVGEIDISALKRDRDQLFAEALALFRDGEPWWVLESEKSHFEVEQEDRFDSDPWEPIISLWAASNPAPNFTASEVFSEALQVDPAHMRPPENRRVGQIMRRLGFERVRRWRQEGSKRIRVWAYEKPFDYGLSANDEDGAKAPWEEAF